MHDAAQRLANTFSSARTPCSTFSMIRIMAVMDSFVFSIVCIDAINQLAMHHVLLLSVNSALAVSAVSFCAASGAAVHFWLCVAVLEPNRFSQAPRHSGSHDLQHRVVFWLILESFI